MIEQMGSLASLASFGQWVVIALISVVGTMLSRRWPNRTLWKFKSDSPPTACLATSGVKDTGKYNRPMTGLGQVQALARIMPSIQEGYGRSRLPQVYLSTDMPSAKTTGDIILLGGAKNNTWTQEAIAKLKDKTGFEFIGDFNEASWEGEIFSGTSEHGKVTKDWAFIICAPNPFCDNKNRIIILAGLHTPGVHAPADYYVTHMKGLRGIVTRNFVAAISVNVDNNQSWSPKLHRLKRIKK